jgi:putative transposase
MLDTLILKKRRHVEMTNIQKNHNAAFKAKIVLETLKGEKTIAQLASDYGVHSNQIGQWKKRVLNELPGIFSDRRKKSEKETEELTSELYRQIGQLKVEVDWLKKKSELFH